MKAVKRNKRIERNKHRQLFVAVIAKLPAMIGEAREVIHSQRPKYMDWTCAIGTNRNKVIDRAIELSREWEFKGFGPYEILVGELHAKAALPTAFKIVKL